MNEPETQLITRLHATPLRGVLAITGGGSAAISRLLGEPGASATVLEAIVPYAHAALDEWLGGKVDSACSEATARAMAVAAMQRARQLEGIEEHDDAERSENLFGVGCTASLASDRPKRGAHRVHVAVQTLDATACWSLQLNKGARTRQEEEAVAASLVLHASATAAGVTGEPYRPDDGDSLTTRRQAGSPLWQTMLWGDGLTGLVDPSRDRTAYSDEPRHDRVLMAGSFAPPHEGHRQMVEVASRLLGQCVTLELSVTNVDKPRLDYLAFEERLSAIAQTLPDTQVWLTRMPTFLDKSKQFGEHTFVVGADTILRIADPRYYRDDAEARDAAIATLAERGCRFLVFGRLAGDVFQTLGDLTLPASLRELCTGVPASEFREDISSTEIRAASEASPQGDSTPS